MTWQQSALRVATNRGDAVTPQQREADEQVRMNELWERLAAVAAEIREIIKIKKSLDHE